MKKFSIKILGALTFLVTAFGFASCVDGGDDSSYREGQMPPKAPQALTLSATSAEIILCDAIQLNAQYGKIEGATLSFTSEDPTIASVTQSGLVTAENVGTTTVTATYGEQKVECEITVGVGDYAPSLVFENSITDNVTISMLEDINLGAEVLFNSNTYEGEITYEVEDALVGSIVEGYFKPSAIGETEVTVTAAWKGLQSPALSKTINVKVISDVEVAVNGGNGTQINLYAKSEHYGKTFNTQSVVDVEIKENGQIVTPSLEILEGADIISLEGGVVTALGKIGTASIKVSYELSSGPDAFFINVNVARPLAKYDSVIPYFSATTMDGKGELKLADIIGSTATITEAYQDGKALTVSNGKISKFTCEERAVTHSTLTVYTDEGVGYEIDVEAYKDAITTFEELRSVLDLNSNSKSIKGYYALAKDIEYDASAAAIAHDYALSASAGFNGIFDGCGHSISANIGAMGLFGRIGRGAIIKNLALTNVVLDESAAYACVLARNDGATKEEYNTIENVYVSIANFARGEKAGDSTAALMYERNVYTRYTNLVVVLDAPMAFKTIDSAPTQDNYGAMFCKDSITKNEGAYLTQFNNVFVISGAAIPMALSVDGYNTYNYAYFAENDGVEVDTEGKATGRHYYLTKNAQVYECEYVYKGVMRYDTLAAMKTSNLDYFSFNEYWDTDVYGVPVFKSAIASLAKVSLGNKTMVSNAIINTEAATKLDVTVDGVSIPATFSVAATDSEYATIANGTNGWTITGTKATATGKFVEVTATWTYLGENYSQTFQVAVKPIATPYEETVKMFSALDGDLAVSSIFGADVTITEAWEGDRKLTVQDNKILGVAYSNNSMRTATVTLYTETEAKIVNLEVYTKVIKTPDEFLFYINGYDTVAKKALQTTREGYYILANDIGSVDSPVYTNRSTSAKYVFNATLDGNGYTAYVKMGYYGLLDTLGANCVIKNFGIVVVSWRYAPATTAGHRTIFASNMEPGFTLDNLYVKVMHTNSTASSPYLIGKGLQTNTEVISTVSNIIYEVEDGEMMLYKANNGLLFPYDQGMLDGVSDGSESLINVNIITPYKYLGVTDAGVATFAQNDTAAKDAIDATMRDGDGNNNTFVAGRDFNDGKSYRSIQYGWLTVASGDSESRTETGADKRIVNRYDDYAAFMADEAIQNDTVGGWTVTASGVVWNR